MQRPDPDLWQATLETLRREHPGICRHWFDLIEPLSIDGGTLRLLVREPVQLKYLRHYCQDEFNDAVRSASGHLLTVHFVGEAALEPSVRPPARPPVAGDGGSPDGTAATESARPATRPATFTVGRGATAVDEMVLSPDNSFDHFVMGPSNQLAHAAAKAVAAKPGVAYNPLFIHGGVGLGKTHLLQAICQAVLARSPSLTIHYTSCDGFMNAFHQDVQKGQLPEFRHRYRSVDLLVIDDIHDLAERDRTQEEFFHTFNALTQAGKQIVLSSDAPPSEIPDLEERLSSRFNSGLVARIDRPCYETRVRILQTKAGLRGLELPAEVASYMASRIESNIRDLEGAITKIIGVAQLTGQSVSIEVAKQAIGDTVVGGAATQTMSIQDILDAIIDYYGVKLTDLLSKRRHKSIALPRQVGMWLARRHTRFSLEEIGSYFGGRDHTTVMHAVRAIDERRQSNSTLDHDVSRLEERLVLGGRDGRDGREARRPGRDR